MDKLKMQTKNFVDENIAYISQKFPNCISEGKVDFDLLRQELSNVLVEGRDERYRLDWAGKRQAILTANSPIAKTLRPCREESVNFDTTENLYIEGDNLDVLKLLHETYLNKVKMIYIDPPYNTGKDFVYNDDFAVDSEEYLALSNQTDEQGNRMSTNKETSGRYHSDWLSMMYMRLKLAKDLLTEDGAIFISIDDNEQANLKKICDEIFGIKNWVGEVIRKTKSMTGDNGVGFNLQHESLFIYAKNIETFYLTGDLKDFEAYKNPDNDPKGDWVLADPSAKSGGETTYFEIINPFTNKIDLPPLGRYWAFSKNTLNNYVSSGRIVFKKEHGEKERGFIFKRYKNELSTIHNPMPSLFIDNSYMNQSATIELNKLFDNSMFDYPKPIAFIYKIMKSCTQNDDIILDFFSGSATTAHAVMQLNAEDGGNRKFIMVQLPELTDEKSEAYKAGYKNICEIGKERIRRAGLAVIQNDGKGGNLKFSKRGGILLDDDDPNPVTDLIINGKRFDKGFRVLKLADSNMKDVYYNPKEYNQSMLLGLDSSIKEDRTAEDLLFQVMLDKGVLLSSKIEKKTTENGEQSYYIVGETGFGIIDLICCLDKKVNTDAVKEIAKLQPECCVFLDSGIENDATRTNIQQLFTTYSPKTKVEVL